VGGVHFTSPLRLATVGIMDYVETWTSVLTHHAQRSMVETNLAADRQIDSGLLAALNLSLVS